ncbi:MAG: hypothetical protein RL320_646 [Pseudomonadota bacterium]|jgi:UDP-N-acetylglucosamine--N-acetylmuramyl-(pentapeptide) pyrophosphoryl-undecaprenol N-acetylglucosamine transferase
MRVLIAAGGTGGHVFPALAVAQSLRARGFEVHWLGTDRGLEARTTAAAGIPLTILHGFQGVRGKGFSAWLGLPFRLLRALRQTWQLMDGLRPRVVMTFGGYVTVPAGLVSRLKGLPLLVHEQNAVMGSANRLLSGWATVVAMSFAVTRSAPLTAVLTGNPVRPEIAALGPSAPRISARAGALRVLVVGGSLGALALNRALPALLVQAAQRAAEGLEVWHQSGAASEAETRQAYGTDDAQAALKSVRVDAFIEDMAAAYTWADCVICRAGASTVSELIELGLPALLIPLPTAIDDHQTANAQAMVSLGLAQMIPQHAHDFNEQVLRALSQMTRSHLSSLAAAARPEQATERLVSLALPFLMEPSV